MPTFTHQAARACLNHAEDVSTIEYSGPLCLMGFDALRKTIYSRPELPGALLIKMDKALLLFGEMPKAPEGMYSPETPPAAVIGRDDQLTLWRQHAQYLADNFGVMRVVFSVRQEALAKEWVVRRARPARPVANSLALHASWCATPGLPACQKQAQCQARVQTETKAPYPLCMGSKASNPALSLRQ